jgi:phage terminase large subunit GpA-like protein
MTALPRHPLLRQLYRKNIVKPLDEQRRSFLDFSTEEIIIPRGKFKGQPYNPRRKPASILWFNELDSHRWQIHNYTGPTQSGKTLDAFIIPILYCLFEKEEDVIVGIPDMKMSMAKWRKDILPVLIRSQYARFLPDKGKGSRGGELHEVAFKNGTYLTFMSFGGGDKARAGDTAPNLIITETDGANEVSENSEEGTKIQQLIGRTLSYDLEAFIVMECTVTTDEGITWQNHVKGTESRIGRPCHACGEYVSPERDHFHGWQEATDEIQAGQLAQFRCPNCAEPWTDEQRFQANRRSKLIHRGQTIDKHGRITGELPRTSTLGFRCSAIDNFLRSSEFLGRLMWKAVREEDREAADRTIKQQQFAEAVTRKDDELPPLALHDTASRIVRGVSGTQQGIVPEGYSTLTVGTDLRATQLHWVAIAWLPDATARVIDYGIYNVPSRKFGHEVALRWALTKMRDDVLIHGFKTESGEIQHIDRWWIDAGWMPDPIYKFARESKLQNKFWEKRLSPYLGRGVGAQYYGKETQGNYHHPEKPGGKVLRIIDQAHRRYNINQQSSYWMIDADHYKVFVHNRLRIPLYVQDFDDDGNPIPITDYDSAELTPGAMSLFVPRSGDHIEYIRQLLAERQTTQFVPDRGPVTKMVVVSQVNHFLDATYAASAAAVDCGIATTPPVIRPRQPASTFGSGSSIPDDRIPMPGGGYFDY